MVVKSNFIRKVSSFTAAFVVAAALSVAATPVQGATVNVSSTAHTSSKPISTAVTAKGSKGQLFTASAARNLADGQKIMLTGKGYNTKIGIYVTYCVVPPKGQKPSECGPFDITGKNNASFWISSNPPLYAAALVTPFGKGGSFKVSMAATRFIGESDCAVVRCAFTTRADHTQSDVRSADVFVPVTFRK